LKEWFASKRIGQDWFASTQYPCHIYGLHTKRPAKSFFALGAGALTWRSSRRAGLHDLEIFTGCRARPCARHPDPDAMLV